MSPQENLYFQDFWCVFKEVFSFTLVMLWRWEERTLLKSKRTGYKAVCLPSEDPSSVADISKPSGTLP